MNPGSYIKKTSDFLLRSVFPWGSCKLCGKEIKFGAVPEICFSCFKKRRKIKEPVCRICGRELPGSAENLFCGACLAERPSYERHISQYFYEGVIRELVLLFKVEKRYPLAALIGGSITKKIRTAYKDENFDIVTFVPGSFRRRLARRFNPAELLAKIVSRELHVQLKDLLEMKRGPKPQKGLTAKTRRENVKGAFSCPSEFKKNERILLIDDIFTTGSTMEESAKALKKRGALVYAATFAMRPKREISLESSSGEEPQTL